jgi:hypothetical protein
VEILCFKITRNLKQSQNQNDNIFAELKHHAAVTFFRGTQGEMQLSLSTQPHIPRQPKK